MYFCSILNFYLRQFIARLEKLKILFITTQLPFPPKSGGTVKSWNYVQFLAQNYRLSVATLLKDDDEIHEGEFQKTIPLQQFVSEKVVIPRNPFNLIKSYFFAPSLNVFRNSSIAFRKKLLPLIAENSILIIDHYEVFQYVPNSFKGKVIMHTHNAEFMLWQRMSELTSNPIKKFILNLEGKRVKTYEKEIFQKAHLIYSTPSDIKLYQNHGFDVSKHQVTYHLGNDTLLDLTDLEFQQTEKAITFIGTLSWEPNVDGIVWFLEKSWPSILEKHPDCKLYILGKSADDRILRASKQHPNVVFTGFVSNLEDYLKKTRVYIAPLRFGSGMKVKVLEGLYRGVATVTTSVGAEGLKISDGNEVMIADTEEKFTSDCLLLLEDSTLWSALRDKSRRLAQKEYLWSSLFQKMDEALQGLIR